MTTPSLHDLLTALLWSVIACGGTWLLTTPLRRHVSGGLLASVVLSATAASVGASLGSIHAMLLPMRAERSVIVIAAVAGLVAAATTGLAARKQAKDREVLRAAVADVGEGRVPDAGGRRLSSELERVRNELRTTAQGLAVSRERERALESARRELVAWVSHDLRTPLAGIRAITEALEDGIAEDTALYYKQLRASVDQLASLVDDLFDLSRIQAGVVSRDAEAIALDDLISDGLAALQPLAAAGGVRLTGSTAGAAPVTGNASELNRALTNLVANAIHHTPSGGRVDVRIEVGAEAEVSVVDECGGIPADDLPRVFDVGFRGETARTPHSVQPGGAGLGLAITRGIIEAHGGRVAVENTATGCRFVVRLPVG